jgi:hypothetical protein
MRLAGAPFVVAGSIAAGALSAADSPRPVLVSPVAREGEARVGTTCPTFSWTLVPGALRYEWVIYDSGPGGATKPLQRADIPGGATSWTPNLEQCLPPGRYGWAVGAVLDNNEAPHWSPAAVIRVEAPLRTSRNEAAAAETGRPTLPPPGLDSPGKPRPIVANAFSPPLPDGSLAPDCPIGDPSCAWFAQALRDGIFAPCSSGLCLDDPVTRRQLAMHLERAMRGTDTWRPELGDGTLPNLRPAGAVTPLVDPGVTSGLTSITIGVDGLGLVSYADAGQLMVAHCSNLDCSSTSVTPLGGTAVQVTSITIGGDGLGLIVFSDGSTVKIAHCSNVACTAAALRTVSVATPDGAAVATGADGFGFVAFRETSFSSVQLVRCLDAACSTSPSPVFVSDPHAGHPVVAIGTDGFPLFVYGRTDGFTNLLVAHCTSRDCSGTIDVTSVDISGHDPSSTVVPSASVAIGADGFALIAYPDSSGLLRVRHCSNLACSSSAAIPIEFVGSQVVSLAIGADGLGVVAYRFLADLKVAHCATTDCSAVTLLAVEADPAEVEDEGAGVSITIGADGLPLISYLDLTGPEAGLRVAHCSNVLCAPFFRRR